MTKIKKFYSNQKQTTKALSMTSEGYSGLKIKKIDEKIGILDIYKLNIYLLINLMFRIKKNTMTKAF